MTLQNDAPPSTAAMGLAGSRSFRLRLATLVLAIALGTLLALRERAVGPPPAASVIVPVSGAVTIAAVGDTVIGRPIPRSERDGDFDAIAGVLRSATLAVANLEVNLLDEQSAGSARNNGGPSWTFGTAREAEELAALGVDVVGQANDHATDYGQDGMSDTRALLGVAGLVTAGAGADLDEARTAAMIGGARKAAVVAVAISAAPESMATATRGIVNGRPGVNPLRYVADVTLDAATYETLRRSAPALQGGSETAGDRFTLLGTSIRRGTETVVNLVPDVADLKAILAEVSRAREVAEIVMLSVHSHEPSNESDEPAELFRGLAQQAIDAGAQLVVGHGPRRLRGVEVYKGAAILYSVGNFLYLPAEGLAPPQNIYEAGFDMYSLALGMSAPPAGRSVTAGDGFWDGIAAVATFDTGRLRALRLQPIDLGGDLPAARRGVPRKPSAARAAALLERLARLSQPYRTILRMEDGVGIVEIDWTGSGAHGTPRTTPSYDQARDEAIGRKR
jgi:poly-gamma-glutamate capsule biosynthesis protein CapA/YwtB (metallophosphatase superfamily)